MNLVADGCWGAEAVLMLPLTLPSFASGPGSTHGAVPIPFTAYSWPQHEPYSCASQSPHLSVQQVGGVPAQPKSQSLQPQSQVGPLTTLSVAGHAGNCPSLPSFTPCTASPKAPAPPSAFPR